MNGLYRNPQLGERMARMPALPRHFDRVDGPYERVITLSIATDSASGLVGVMLSIDEVGADLGAYPTLLAVYPLGEQMHAQEDALLVARKLGMRLRRATERHGWQWVRTDADMPAPGGPDLVIGG